TWSRVFPTANAASSSSRRCVRRRFLTARVRVGRLRFRRAPRERRVRAWPSGAGAERRGVSCSCASGAHYRSVGSEWRCTTLDTQRRPRRSRPDLAWTARPHSRRSALLNQWSHAGVVATALLSLARDGSLDGDFLSSVTVQAVALR